MMNLQDYKSTIIPSVTVIIPVYNEERSIEDCICSLRKQSVPLEIVVVDDGSKDNSVKICEGLKVKVLRQDHKGPGAARNLGARNTEGNILLLADADMEFEPDFVAKLIVPIVKGDAIATCHWNERVVNWGNPWARCQTWFFGLPDKRRHPLQVPEYEEVYRAVRKDFFIDSGGYEEKMGRGEDRFVARQTGVMAKIVADAICYHNNAGSAGEVFRDTLWRGRTVPEGQKQKLRRGLAALFYQNPIKIFIRGIILCIKKQELYMPLYAVVYSVGFALGVIQALVYKKYAK